MNRALLTGRLTRDPDVRYSQGEPQVAVARYILAVDRYYKKDGEQTADFIRCVTFGKNAEFAEKYLHRGIKIVIEGRIQTGSYTDKDGRNVYTTDIVVERHEFAESENATDTDGQPTADQTDGDGFLNIPEGIDDELPFN